MAALPTTGIDTTLVRNTLGESNNEVSDLCKSNKINMWSRRKPVIDSRIEIPFSEVGDSPSNFWGLSLPAYGGDDTALTTYHKPTSKFREGDFRGYNHNALIPILIPEVPTNIERRENTFTFIAGQTSTDSLVITDFGYELRLGVMVYDSGGALVGSASAQNAGDTNVTVDFSDFPFETYVTLKWCLIDEYKPWGLTGMNPDYELPRETVGQNPNWEDVQLVAAQVNPPVTTFQVGHDPLNNEIDVTVETLNYTGTIYVQFLTSDLSSIEHTATFIVSSSGVEYDFTTTDNWVTGGDSYVARLWLDSAPSGAFDAETNFTAFGFG